MGAKVIQKGVIFPGGQMSCIWYIFCFQTWRFPYKQGKLGSSHVSIYLPTGLGLNTNPVPPVMGGRNTGIEDSGEYLCQETELVQTLNFELSFATSVTCIPSSF